MPWRRYDDPESGVFYCWDLTTIEGNPNAVIPGLFWQGRTTLQIQQCPSFEGAADWLNDPYTGYNYNTSYIGHGQGESNPAPAKGSEVRRTSKTILFGDGQYPGWGGQIHARSVAEPWRRELRGTVVGHPRVSPSESEQCPLL